MSRLCEMMFVGVFVCCGECWVDKCGNAGNMV